jgi:hypothetical protein
MQWYAAKMIRTMNNNKKSDDLFKPGNRYQQFKIYESLIHYMLEHACICDIQWCVCKASTFMDTIVSMRQYESEYWQRVIDEVMRR